MAREATEPFWELTVKREWPRTLSVAILGLPLVPSPAVQADRQRDAERAQRDVDAGLDPIDAPGVGETQNGRDRGADGSCSRADRHRQPLRGRLLR
jgi:hypothetical protein